MITKEKLRDYAGKLMFDMEDSEYETLEKEFDVILKQMDLIASIEGIEKIEPMTFPYIIENVKLREDNDYHNIDNEDALRNTDSKRDREIKVPKVVE